MNRHDLIFLSPRGRHAAEVSAALLRKNRENEWVGDLLRSGVPAIFTQQLDTPKGYVDLGICHFLRENGQRRRIKIRIEATGIQEVITPFQVFDAALQRGDLPFQSLLHDLRRTGQQYGFQIGLYGSAALSVMTVYPFFDDTSDIDIYLSPITPLKKESLRGFWEEIHSISPPWKIDCEIRLPNNSACKLQELLSHQKTVMCKGARGVYLERIDKILNEMTCQ